MAAQPWADEVFGVLRRLRISQVGYVPDAGQARLIALAEAEPGMRAVPLTSEEEGVGLAVGAWLGGARAALLMQSSGVGNCINMLTLALNCRAPLLMLVSMRGEWGEFNPWQVPMGQATERVLRALAVIVHRAQREDEAAPMVEAAGRLAFASRVPVAVLLSQRLLGAKVFRAAEETP